MIAGGDARPVGDVNYGVTSVNHYDYRNKSLVKAPDGEMAYPALVPDRGDARERHDPGHGRQGRSGARAARAPRPTRSSIRPASAGRRWRAPPTRSLLNNWNYPRAWLKSNGDVIVYGAISGPRARASTASIRPATATFARSATCRSASSPRCRRSCSSPTRCSRSPPTASSGRSTSAARPRPSPTSAVWARRVIGRT